MHVRAGGVATAAGESDDLSGGDCLTGHHVRALHHVAVPRDHVARVPDVDVPATARDGHAAVLVAAVRLKANVGVAGGHEYDARGGGVHGSALGYGKVHALVQRTV